MSNLMRSSVSKQNWSCVYLEALCGSVRSKHENNNTSHPSTDILPSSLLSTGCNSVSSALFLLYLYSISLTLYKHSPESGRCNDDDCSTQLTPGRILIRGPTFTQAVINNLNTYSIINNLSFAKRLNNEISLQILRQRGWFLPELGRGEGGLQIGCSSSEEAAESPGGQEQCQFWGVSSSLHLWPSQDCAQGKICSWWWSPCTPC